MKITRRERFAVLLVLTVALVLSGASVLAVSDDTALTVKGPEGTKRFTFTEVEELQAVDGWGGMKDSVGNISGPFQYTGVSVKNLVEKVGTFDENKAVKLTAKDGYSMTFSYDQVMNGKFLTYDPATGNETDASGLQLILAYKEKGEPLPEKHGGPIRAVIVDGRKQVTDGHCW